MAKPKTKVFEAYARIRFEIRITPKKMIVDMVNSLGEKRIYCHIERVTTYSYRSEKGYYVASKPNSRWHQQANTIEEIVRAIEKDLDMTIPQEAIDEFAARELMNEVIKNGEPY